MYPAMRQLNKSIAEFGVFKNVIHFVCFVHGNKVMHAEKYYGSVTLVTRALTLNEVSIHSELAMHTLPHRWVWWRKNLLCPKKQVFFQFIPSLFAVLF